MSDFARRQLYDPNWIDRPGVRKAVELASDYATHVAAFRLEGALIAGVLVLPNTSPDRLAFPSNNPTQRVLLAAREIVNSQMSPDTKLATLEALFK